MKFSKRHIGISSSDEKYMLDFLGIDKIDTLISKTIPEDIRMNKALNLENEMSESQFLDHIYKQSEKNKHYNEEIQENNFNVHRKSCFTSKPLRMLLYQLKGLFLVFTHLK